MPKPSSYVVSRDVIHVPPVCRQTSIRLILLFLSYHTFFIHFPLHMHKLYTLCGLNRMHLLSCHHHPPFTTAIAIAHHIPIPGFSLTIHPTFSFRCQSINIMYDEWIISQPKPNQAKPKSSPKRVKFKIGCKLPEAVSAANEIQYNPIGLALLFSFFGIRFPDCSLF